MSDLVALAGVDLTRIAPVNCKGAHQYDGTVRLKVQSANIQFGYAFVFKDAESIPEAIERAMISLKRELEVLAAAAVKANQQPRPTPGEEVEGLDDQ